MSTASVKSWEEADGGNCTIQDYHSAAALKVLGDQELNVVLAWSVAPNDVDEALADRAEANNAENPNMHPAELDDQGLQIPASILVQPSDERTAMLEHDTPLGSHGMNNHFDSAEVASAAPLIEELSLPQCEKESLVIQTLAGGVQPAGNELAGASDASGDIASSEVEDSVMDIDDAALAEPLSQGPHSSRLEEDPISTDASVLGNIVDAPDGSSVLQSGGASSPSAVHDSPGWPLSSNDLGDPTHHRSSWSSSFMVSNRELRQWSDEDDARLVAAYLLHSYDPYWGRGVNWVQFTRRHSQRNNKGWASWYMRKYHLVYNAKRDILMEETGDYEGQIRRDDVW